MSDLHGKYFGANNSVLSEAVADTDPDIVILAGDMCGRDGGIKAAAALTERLKEACENVYYSFGNHESRETEQRTQIISAMESAGATVLNNKSAECTVNGKKVNIHGLELPLYYYTGYDENGRLIYDLTSEEITTYVGEASDETDILIAHNPIYFDVYASWGADIVLSGHNHGGVIRLPWLGGLATPNGDKRPPRFDCGEYKSGDSTMYISRGLGDWIGPVRAFNLPEIYVIDIQ
ncbi:MAG: metallophosphoesterase [Clostridia bacterium]|nr:metallophosphoesterase [Clostridia bacterium]